MIRFNKNKQKLFIIDEQNANAVACSLATEGKHSKQDQIFSEADLEDVRKSHKESLVV